MQQKADDSVPIPLAQANLARDHHRHARPGLVAQAIESLERQTLDAHGMSGTVLRYGWFYGPGTRYDPQGTIPTAMRKGAMPIVGAGAGTYSFTDLRDAAAATVKILAHETSGIYNIVDDSPARFSEWLPLAARLLDAPAPGYMDEASARHKLGDLRVYYMNGQRGASNAKGKREFDWQPGFPSWRAGFEALYSNRSRAVTQAPARTPGAAS